MQEEKSIKSVMQKLKQLGFEYESVQRHSTYENNTRNVLEEKASQITNYIENEVLSNEDDFLRELLKEINEFYEETFLYYAVFNYTKLAIEGKLGNKLSLKK